MSIRQRLLAIRTFTALVQAGAVTAIVFLLLRLLPGDPSYLLAGPSPTPDRIEQIRRSLGLDRPIWEQFSTYIGNLLRGDWGRSITTGNNVRIDILDRLPATVELITLSMAITVVLTIPWATWSAMRPRNYLARIGGWYGRLAGSIPDFWVATISILVFFTWLNLAPAPIGRISVLERPPTRVTGFFTVDAVLAGRPELLPAIFSHLALPVFSLVVFIGGVFYKATRTAVERELATTKTLFAEACGLPDPMVGRRALRNALPPVVATIGNSYAYLMGGAVLVESIFSWGGMGQYAVQAVQASDYFAISGVVLVASLFTLLVYLAVDVVNTTLDPRSRNH